MKRILFLAAALTLGASCLNAQSPATDLTVTLPSGKVVTFQSAEQKATFLASRQRLQVQAQIGTPAAEDQKTAEQAKAEWDKAQADKQAKAEIDARSRQIWFVIRNVNKDGVIADWGPSPGNWKDEVFISCQPEKAWAMGIVFKANVYADGAHDVHYTRLPNYRINGDVSYR